MVGSIQPMEDARSRVLIVDDAVEVHRLLRARLKEDDLEFASAFGADEALEKAFTWKPDLVLLDIVLGGDDGLRLLRTLKADERTRDVPVIVLSAQQSPEQKVTAFDLGAVDYITKPFEMVELRVRLRSALRVHQLVTMLAVKAQIDGLTGLWNRAFFDHRWAEEYARAQRHGHPLSIALIDIDHFKRVNDRFGHPVGDIVLQNVARTLRRECRAGDLVCRYGGEEFVIVMPDTPARDAGTLCQRLRAAVEEMVWSRSTELHVTASIGVAGAGGSTVLTHEQWVELADKNLYQAKRAGRNRVIVSEVPTGAGNPVREAG
ncbi:MAG TPA: diguanylate cyclase [Phycisphaerales bacterium]|nr:diguanylate cyclase [Phycisphaerales bacterium]